MYKTDIKENQYDIYARETDNKWSQIMSELNFTQFNILNKEYQEIVKKYRIW